MYRRNVPSFRLAACARAVSSVIGAWAALSSAPAAAQSADPASTTQLEKVEVTGSVIKRIDGETALPVQVITKADIEKAAVTTAGELLSKLSANSAPLTDGASFSDIAGQRGFNGANLRGIGVSSTLVLLNGRRIANFASPGANSGVDLNAIPIAAINRVEVLKDGASAIYGSDAIGGVINFITQSSYQGAEASAYRLETQHGGADKNIFTLSAGFGDLATDRFNLFAVLDVQHTTTLRSGQRDWIGSVYQPDINLDVGSSNTYPANVRRTRNGAPTGARFNPAAPACNPPATVYAPGSFVGNTACLYDYMQDTEIYPQSKHLSLLTRAQYALDAQNTLFAEYLYSQTKTNYRISPLTVTNLNYPTTGIYYPTSLGLTGPLRVGLRLTEAGNRTNDVESTAQRFLAGAKGTLAAWDYDTALYHSEDRVTDAYVNGYVATTPFNAAFATGNINPFGPSSPAGRALLDSTKISDDARKSKGVTDSLDARATRSLFALPGGDAAVAVGLEARHESLDFTPSSLLAAGEIRGDGASSAFKGSRDVQAIYAELSLPVVRSVEVQLAARTDHYSDVGTTTNPKIGIRFTPIREVLFRASAGTGFRAPSLADLYSPPRTGQTNGIYNDPLGCIRTATVDNTNNPDYCGIQPDKLTGGNAALKPEKSKQYSAGVVFEPSKLMTASLDYWRIRKTDVVTGPEGVLFDDPVRYAQYILRAPADPTLPGIPGFITAVDSRLRNFAALRTSGIDLGVDLRSPETGFGRFGLGFTGTYVIDYKTQAGADAPSVSGAGVFANDQVVQRWRHLATLSYDYGPFSAALSQTFYLGYRDQTPLANGEYRRVGSYSLLDLTASYQITKALRVRGGIKNLVDANPPVSNQIYSFLAGYDPNYTDPRGRSFFASLTYALR